MFLAIFYICEFYAVKEPNGLKDKEMSESKNNTHRVVLWRWMLLSRSLLSKEIGIPVAVQGRKSSILCWSGQAPQSLAKRCKKKKKETKLIKNKLKKFSWKILKYRSIKYLKI